MRYGKIMNRAGHMTIQHIRIACRIPKAILNTHTHRICNMCYFSTATMAAILRLNITLYESCLSSLTFGSGYIHLKNALVSELELRSLSVIIGVS
jgi:hypothetical protein